MERGRLEEPAPSWVWKKKLLVVAKHVNFRHFLLCYYCKIFPVISLQSYYHEEGRSWARRASWHLVQELDSFSPKVLTFSGRLMGDYWTFECGTINRQRFNYMRIPDYVGEVISRIGVLMYLWFAIQGQCVVVIPAILVYEPINNKMIAKNNLVHLELPTRPAQKCQPFGTCPRPPPALRPYCCEGSLKLLLVYFHDWGVISCYLIEVFACIHSGVASL